MTEIISDSSKDPVNSKSVRWIEGLEGWESCWNLKGEILQYEALRRNKTQILSIS